MIESVDTILLNDSNNEEVEVTMAFKDCIAIEVDDSGDVPLFSDPMVMTYPSENDVMETPEMVSKIELYTGRPVDRNDSCFFDIALVYGVHRRLSEIIKAKPT